MSDDPYVYPGTTVLKNKLGIRDAAKLDHAERRLVVDRIAEGVPAGDFDLAHLKAIHRHLFQDIYAWAGKIRTVEISKGGSHFMFRQYIETGMADVHKRIVKARCFAGTSPDEFAAGTSVINWRCQSRPSVSGRQRPHPVAVSQTARRTRRA